MISRTRFWAWARPLGGAAILGALVVRLGAEPFLDGLRATTAWALLAAVAITAATTWCCATRWSLLARQLDVPVPFDAAYRACYRSQFLNATLPGGVLGDVHRAVRHGRDAGAVGRGLRSVGWDRATGQVVQVALALVAVVLLPAPVRVWLLGLVGIVVAVVAVAVVALPARFRRALWVEVRQVPSAAGVWPRVVLVSTLAAGGHLLVFLVAARTAGITASLGLLVPLGLVVLVASAVPVNIAGWGPREGAAAWAFAQAGLGAGAGVSVAVVYGVMALVATLPGALVLLSRADRAPALARADRVVEEPAHG